MWNKTIARLQEQYEKEGECDWCYKGYSKHITALRKENDFLQEVSGKYVRASMQAISTQYQNFFKKQGGLPKFHSRHKEHNYFKLVEHGSAFKVRGDDREIYIQKIGRMKMTGSNPYKKCEVKSGTVKQECGKWYAYITYEVPENMLKPSGENTVGIDRNINNFTLSNGKVYTPPLLTHLRERKKRFQKMMSRRFTKQNKTKGYLFAKRRHKAVSAMIAHCLNNWTHHTSRTIANEFGLVALEDLDIQKMTKNDGNYKRKLNYEILNSCWGNLHRKLAYKTAVETVEPQYTSQDCSQCGNRGVRDKDSFKCGCGFEMNADLNAAKNILQKVRCEPLPRVSVGTLVEA